MTIGFWRNPLINADETQAAATRDCTPNHDPNMWGSSNFMSVPFLTLNPYWLIGIISNQVESLFICEYNLVPHLLIPADMRSGKNKTFMAMLGSQLLTILDLSMTEVILVKFSMDCVIWNWKSSRISKFCCSHELLLMELIDKMAAFMHRHLGGSPMLLWIHGPLLDDAIDSCTVELEVSQHSHHCSRVRRFLCKWGLLLSFLSWFLSFWIINLSYHLRDPLFSQKVAKFCPIIRNPGTRI